MEKKIFARRREHLYRTRKQAYTAMKSDLGLCGAQSSRV